ncbi:conserved hypothetical protein [Thiomonas sp. CB3]|nr:conserved hypothetical protein [Thiomonas sp. CB3]
MAESLTAIEPQLVARLQSRLPQTGAGKVHVLTAAELANLSESTQPSPAVHIVLSGMTVAESRPDGKAARLTQTWLAVIAVRNLASGKTGAAARADAGQLAGTVAAALTGWQPLSARKPLQLVTPPGAGYSAGYMYLPIAVATDVLVQQE